MALKQAKNDMETCQR